MSKKNIIIIVVAVTLLIAGGLVAYALMQKQSDSSNNNTNNNGSQDSNGAMGEVSTNLQSLLTGPSNRVCTYSDQEGSGTVYVAGDDRLRVDYSSTDPEQPAGSMIMTKDKVYTWELGAQEGFTMPAYEGSTDGNAGSGEYDFTEEDAVDVNKDYNFSCDNWSVDSSQFTPPASVEFNDIEAMMREVQ